MDFITLLDGIVIVVMLMSALLAMYRGFLREVLSIASWVAAAGVTYVFHKPLLPMVKAYVPNDSVALGVTLVGLFVVTLLVVSWITMKISDFVLDSAFGALDRSAGFLFGAGRGYLLCVIAFIFFAWLVPEKNYPAWVQNSKTRAWLEATGSSLQAMLQTLGMFPHPRRIAVYSAAGDRRDVDMIEQGQMLGKAFDEVILYEDQYLRGREPGEIMKLFDQGLREGGRVQQTRPVQGWAKAVELVLELIRPGDLVLLQADTIDEAVNVVKQLMDSQASTREIQLKDAVRGPSHSRRV